MTSKILVSLEKFLPLILMGATLLVLTLEEGARMYFPYFFLSYAIGCLIYYYERPSLQQGMTARNFLFPREIWLHRSAKQDYAITLINVCLTATILPYLVINYNVYREWLIAGVTYLGAPAPVDTGTNPGVIAVVLFTLLSFMLSDLFYYWSHRLTHKVAFLWEFHKLHHSAEVMTPVTLHRAHPMDILLNVGMRMMGLGVASAIFYYIYPTNRGLLTITGTNVFLILCYVLGANLRHSHLWLTYGPRIEHVMMSPAQHQIHHSTDSRHFNKNYGADLALWDWVFGSLYLIKGKEAITFGLGNQHDNSQSLLKLYFNPFLRSWKVLKKTLKKKLARSAAPSLPR